MLKQNIKYNQFKIKWLQKMGNFYMKTVVKIGPSSF